MIFVRWILLFFIFIAYSKNVIIEKNKIDVSMILKYMIDPDIRCFLNVIALSEGTSKQNKIKFRCFKPSWAEYLVSFGYTQKVDLYKYPGNLFCTRGKKNLCSSAVGRYQFIRKTWKYLTSKYKQDQIFDNNKDFFISFLENIKLYYDDTVIEKYQTIDDFIHYKFGPFWQDFYAIVLLVQGKLIDPIKNRNLENVCQKISFIWPSFPKNKLNENRYRDGVNNAKSFAYIVRLFETQMKKRKEKTSEV